MARKAPKWPLINGNAFSFASVTCKMTCEATGQTFDLGSDGFSAVNFDNSRKRGQVRSAHPDPRAKTRGQNEPSGSAKFYKSTADYIQSVVLGGPGYKDRSFTFEVQYIERDQDVSTVEMRGCTWDTSKHDNTKGTDATEVEVDFSPLKVIINGEDDVDNPLAAA